MAGGLQHSSVISKSHLLIVISMSKVIGFRKQQNAFQTPFDCAYRTENLALIGYNTVTDSKRHAAELSDTAAPIREGTSWSNTRNQTVAHTFISSLPPSCFPPSFYPPSFLPFFSLEITHTRLENLSCYYPANQLSATKAFSSKANDCMERRRRPR